jgi:formate hydrogenlyase transcriptional activator
MIAAKIWSFWGRECEMSVDRVDYCDALFKVALSISGHKDLDSLCRALSLSLKQVLNFDFLFIMLHEAPHNVLRLHGLPFAEGIEPKGLRAVSIDSTPAGQVWKDQQPLVIPILDREDRWPEFTGPLRERGIRSVFLEPLTTADRRLGVLGFGSLAHTQSGEEELAFIGRVASELAVTIDSYLIQEKFLREHNRLQLLFDITNVLVSKLSPDALFSAISEQLNRVISYDFAFLTLLDPKTGELHLSGLHCAGEARLDLDQCSASRDGLPCAEALSSGKPVVMNELDFDRFPSPIYRRWADAGFRSGCSIPLVMGSATLGTLELARTSGEAFTEEDVELLLQVARQIAIALENSLAYRELAEMKEKLATEKLNLENDIRFDQNFGDMLGESAAFQSVIKSLQIVAPTDSTVLILGETGTGKELVARAIHGMSARSKQSFVKINCAAIPSSLLESELFGHEKGSFTGALARRIGRFELAHQGTLFLDEIGEIPLELQPKLLRAIQELEFERLGGSRTIRVDVRFVAASNRNLKAMVDEGKFRSDLYYRLHVFPLHVPPLRERRQDIPLLARYFIRKYAQRMNRKIDTIPSSTMDILTRHDWPGNVRELQNVIERSVVLSQGPVFELAIPEMVAAPTAAPSRPRVAAVEREHILKALKDANGIISGPGGAAERLGLKRTTLQSRMKKLGINRNYS